MWIHDKPIISMGYCKKDVTPVLTHWSYVFHALTHQYEFHVVSSYFIPWPVCYLDIWKHHHLLILLPHVHIEATYSRLIVSNITQQIGVQEASLVCLLVLEILCSRQKLTFMLMLNTWCGFHVFGCTLSVYQLRSHIWILGLCRFTLSLHCFRAHGELQLVSN